MYNYEEYVNNNNYSKVMLVNQGFIKNLKCFPHIDHIELAERISDDMAVFNEDMLRWGFQTNRVKIKDLASAARLARFAVSNPSILKDWRGWGLDDLELKSPVAKASLEKINRYARAFILYLKDANPELYYAILQCNLITPLEDVFDEYTKEIAPEGEKSITQEKMGAILNNILLPKLKFLADYTDKDVTLTCCAFLQGRVVNAKELLNGKLKDFYNETPQHMRDESHGYFINSLVYAAKGRCLEYIKHSFNDRDKVSRMVFNYMTYFMHYHDKEVSYISINSLKDLVSSLNVNFEDFLGQTLPSIYTMYYEKPYIKRSVKV